MINSISFQFMSFYLVKLTFPFSSFLASSTSKFHLFCRWSWNIILYWYSRTICKIVFNFQNKFSVFYWWLTVFHFRLRHCILWNWCFLSLLFHPVPFQNSACPAVAPDTSSSTLSKRRQRLGFKQWRNFHDLTGQRYCAWKINQNVSLTWSMFQLLEGDNSTKVFGN